jgi:hypothetical protein
VERLPRPRLRVTRRTTEPLSREAARIVELEQKVDEQVRKIGEQEGTSPRPRAAASPLPSISRAGAGAELLLAHAVEDHIRLSDG